MKAKETKNQNLKRPPANLKTLTRNYENNLRAFMRLSFDQLLKLEDDYKLKATELGLSMAQDLESSRDRIENLFQKNTVCTKSLVLHFKMTHLGGCYNDYLGKHKIAFDLFLKANEFINIYSERIYQEEDSAFHEQLYHLLVFFSSLSSIEKEDIEAVRQIRKEVLPQILTFITKLCEHKYSTNFINYRRALALNKPLSKSEQLKLGLQIESNLKYTNSLILSLNENGLYYDYLLLLHLLIQILYGDFANYINEKEDAILSYIDAFWIFKARISLLKFETNFGFQDQIYRLFEQLHDLDENKLKDIYPELESLEAVFIKKCGISIVVVKKAYEKYLKLFCPSQAPLTNERTDFFSKATQLKNSYQHLKVSNRLPFEYQVYLLANYYYMLNLSLLSQPRRLLKFLYVGKMTIYFVNDSQLNVETLNYFLNSWSNLKKLYIEPSLVLIRGLEMSEVHINLLIYCLDSLKYWTSLYFAIFSLIKKLIDKEFKNLEQMQNINDQDQQEIMKLIFKLQPEIQFLMKIATLLEKAAQEINAKIEVNELKDEITISQKVQIMRDQSTELNNKINTLKTKLENLKNLSIKSQNELIKAEQQHKAQQPVKKPKKQIPIQEYAIEVISSDDDSTTEEQEHCPINPNLEMLQAVDIELSYRINKLKPELTRFLVYLEERLTEHEIPLPGDEHLKAFSSSTELTLQSYELEQLFGQFKVLEQSVEIKSLCKQQPVIKINHGEHDRAINAIGADLAKIKKVYDKVNLRHQDGKLNKIYEYGLKKIKLQNPNFDISKCGFEQKKLEDPNLKIYDYELEQKKLQYKDRIYKRIMKLGRIEFIRVGEEKRNKGEQLSQYSNQNEFLGSVDIVFISLDYLQEKMKTNSLTSSEHLFFNREKKEKICTGRFEGAIGLLYKNKYQLTGNTNFLYKSIMHLDKSFIYYEKRINSECVLADLSYHLGRVKEKLMSQDLDNSNLANEILVHYQAALEFNALLKSSSLNKKRLLEINTRIEALKNNLGNFIKIS